MTRISARKLGTEHAGELLTLRRAAFAQAAAQVGDAQMWAMAEDINKVTADLARPDVVHVGAFQEGRLVAAVQLTIDGSTAYVDRLAVAPDMQNQGVGIAMVSEVPALLPAGVTEVEVPQDYDQNVGELVRAYLRHLA